MKHRCQRRNNFITICQWKELQKLTTSMLKESGKILDYKLLTNIMTCTYRVIPYCLQTNLKVSETATLKFMTRSYLFFFFFFSGHGLERQACLQKTDVKLEFLTDADTLLMVENDVTDGIFYSVKRYTKANNKYMKDNDPRTEFSYLIYWDVNNLYGQASSQKLPVDDFKLKKSKSKFTQKFIQNYNNDMMTATKDTPLRLILVIPSIYLSEDTQLSPVFA